MGRQFGQGKFNLSARPHDMVFIIWGFIILAYVEILRGAQDLTAIVVHLARDGPDSDEIGDYNDEAVRGALDIVLGFSSLSVVLNMGTHQGWLHFLIRLIAIGFFLEESEYFIDNRMMIQVFVIQSLIYLTDIYEEFEWFSFLIWRPFDPKRGAGIHWPWNMPTVRSADAQTEHAMELQDLIDEENEEDEN